MLPLAKVCATGLISLLSVVALSQTQAPGATKPEPGAAAESAGGLPDAITPATGDDAFLKPGVDPQNRLLVPFLHHLAKDQKQFWLSPTGLNRDSAITLGAFGAITGAFIASDSWLSRQVPDAPSQLRSSKHISDYGLYTLVGAGGGAFLLGQVKHNDHLSEAGLLSGEAAINGTAIDYIFKVITQRPRPLAGNGNGTFFEGGGSFPSEHTVAAWSIASVLAHEYSGPLTQFLAYGLASTVTLTRVTSKQHFPSDVIVGSALGWYMGRQVYRAHHDPELGGAAWGALTDPTERQPRTLAHMGSPYVPLDSWIYPAFDRLIAMNRMPSAIVGMRPWTRLECARLLEESASPLRSLDYTSNDQESAQLYDSLSREFAGEISLDSGEQNRNFRIESIYSRVTAISGTPLTDGFHFGQTIANDFGRPYAGGFSAVEGLSAWATQGAFTAYVRGEYQHAPSTPPLSDSARVAIANADFLPVPPPISTSPTNRFQLLDAYLAYKTSDWQFSFGNQSLQWGPNRSGPLMFSDNAVPVTMFRIERVAPFQFPGIFGFMGPTRSEFLVGRLAGQSFVAGAQTGLIGQWGQALTDQPFIIGQKLNFKPTANFEFGVDYTRISGGPGQPFTFLQFVRSTLSLGNGRPGTSSDPGDVRSGIDFSYKVPGLRNWLTFYGDAFTEDEFSPLAYPRKAAFQGGLYMPRVPGLRKLDLRVEGGSTSPVDFGDCNGCFYWNVRFRNAYTSHGNPLGSWIGRASQGEQVWSTYWLSPRNTIQFNYRHRKIDDQFLPGGGTVNDGGVKADFWVGASMKLSGSVQYERWSVPALEPLPKTNLTTSIELSFWPGDRSLHRHQ